MQPLQQPVAVAACAVAGVVAAELYFGANQLAALEGKKDPHIRTKSFIRAELELYCDSVWDGI